MNDLLSNLDRLHTTPLGIQRVIRNLSLEVPSPGIVGWCREQIAKSHAVIIRRGKNYYVHVDRYIFTVNAGSYTLITAHRTRQGPEPEQS